MLPEVQVLEDALYNKEMFKLEDIQKAKEALLAVEEDSLETDMEEYLRSNLKDFDVMAPESGVQLLVYQIVSLA